MPGSSTTPGRSDLAMVRPKRVAFRARNSVGTRGLAFAAQWLAYALPYRRFVGVLTDANARLGADVDRYSFIVVDLHHLLLAGLPAHFESHDPSQPVRLQCLLKGSALSTAGRLPRSRPYQPPPRMITRRITGLFRGDWAPVRRDGVLLENRHCASRKSTALATRCPRCSETC
jgi:hypothetical protein